MKAQPELRVTPNLGIKKGTFAREIISLSRNSMEKF